MAAFEDIPLEIHPISVRRAVSIAAERGLYAYDAYLIEAARARGCALMALDKALKEAAGKTGVETLEVSA